MNENAKKEFEKRTRELIGKMTLEEKLDMLTTHHAPCERLGMEEYYIGAEVARGFVSRDPDKISTVFPQPTGLAGTFDTELMEKLGAIAADEARAYYNENRRGGIALWGPTVDMARDPRWGRNEEAYGEDPCLTGKMSAAYTKGMEGDDGRFVKSVPTLKHFCADNNEEDRGSCNASLPLRLKYEYYYAPFEYAIRHGGAKSVMAAYNEINGCPAVINPELKTMLKDEWGLWYVVTDGGDFSQTVTFHRFCKSHAKSLALSLRAGSDSMTDSPDLVRAAAEKALSEGLITEEDIDNTLANTIFSRFALGQFDDCPYNSIDKSVIDCAEHKEINLRAAREQVALLKNDGILPIPKTADIAVLGPLADENLMDWYTGYASGNISVKAAIEDIFKGKSVIHDTLWDIVSVKAPNGKYLTVRPDGTVAAEADTVSESELFELQDWGENWKNLFSVKYKKYIRLSDDGFFRLYNRTVYDWFTRETLNFKPYCGKMLIEEFLRHKRLTCDEQGNITVKKVTAVNSEQLFEINIQSSGRERAEKIASGFEGYIVYCTGNHPVQTAKECYDRKTLELNIQKGMALYLHSLCKNTVMTLISSYPYSVNEEAEKLPALIYTTHAGMYLGKAVCETLTAENNPSGRLSMTWYRSENDLPDIMEYDIESAGTTYMYFEGKPLFPFGHGLSYSSFGYDNFYVYEKEGRLYAHISVTNTSDITGDEVFQLYYALEGSSVKRPSKKLCGFERIKDIAPHETRDVDTEISSDMLRIFDLRRREMITEEGVYTFYAGASSADIRCECRHEIKGKALGKRPESFDAETFDRGENIKIFYSNKLLRHYIRGADWSCSAEYGGISFEGKSAVVITASSPYGKGKVTIDFGNGNKTETELSPSMAFDDFAEYTVKLPENASCLKLSFGENISLMDVILI